MLLLQEIMLEGKKAEELVKECNKDWGMTSSDSDGHSRGSLTAWSLALNLISVQHYGVVVGTELEDNETGKRFMILNVYGPFYDKKPFGKDWKVLEPWTCQT